MGKVRILQDRVANQIAAGEVIERPAAVVKELVENALDAGATSVEVEFRHGGRSLMRVEDNGGGMSKDDALLALERHATSKITEADDLNRLASFGFRGEALPSIASVSRFELQTRETGADAGTEIVVNGGRLVHVRDCGRPVGTRIEVTHLFNSVPARRKFLKSDTTEAAHIIQCVRLYALAFPGVSFTLFEDGRMIFRSPKCTELRDRIAEIFGRQVSEGLVPVEASEDGMRMSGLVGRPGVARGTRHEMISFINQRPVDSRTLNYALIESYHEVLPKGRYPVAFVFFEIDPAAVDVNVHPAKREVRFRSEPQVRGFVIRTLLARLRELTQEMGSFPVPAPVPEEPSWIPVRNFAALPTAVPLEVRRENAPALVSAVPPAGNPVPVAIPVAGTAVGNGVGMEEPRKQEAALRTWRFLGIAHRTLAVFETPSGLVMVDRRAAHERIWFERLEKEFRSGRVASQRLLLAVPIELDAVGSALLVDRLKFFTAHGFEIGEFGRQFFRIEAVPTWMEPADAESFVRDLIGAIREGLFPDRDENLARAELAKLASARAIRLAESAGEVELRGVLAQLFACQQPLTSPSGRSTFVELSLGELARRLGQ